MRPIENEAEVIAALGASLGVRLEPVPSDLAADGPERLWRGSGVVAWAATPARIRDELAGIARGHPLAPELVGRSEHALALAASELVPIDDPAELVVRLAPAEVHRSRGRARDLLSSLEQGISVDRALARVIGRARADRLLNTEMEVATRLGPVLGGVHPSWLRSIGPRAITLGSRHIRPRGWWALDLAALGVHRHTDAREAHRQAMLEELGEHGGAAEAADRAFDLASLACLAREVVIARREPDDLAEAALALLPGAPSHVRLTIEGAPAWLDRSRLEGEVSASQARWILHHYDGLVIAGARLSVRTEPPLRAGRAAPPWRPRAERRRELFSRWDRGIRHDDEGLWSATPEALATQIARGLSGRVIDATCGIGSIAIAIARRPEVSSVVAIDLDPARLEMARHNAAIYGVADRIELLAGDARELVRRIPADALVIDPPWGGRDYDRSEGTLALDPRSIFEGFSGRVVLKLPRSYDVAELGPEWSVEAGIDARNVLKLLIARRPAR